MPNARRSKVSPRGGIDLGGTKIQAAIVTADGEVIGDARRPTPTNGGPKDVAREMVEALVEAAEKAGTQTDSLAGIGVGSPGNVDAATGEVAQARNLPGWEQAFPLAARLSDSLGAEVRVGNDVDVATNGEFRLGAGKPYRSLLGVFWGTGVGGGLILEGRRWLGRGAAGEIGHMVVRQGGRRCPCGRRGCMEAYAGRAAMEAKARRDLAHGEKTELFEIMKKHGKDRLTSSIWERALRHDDPLAVSLIDEAVKALGDRHRLGGQPARHRGRGDRRRARRQARRALRRADRASAWAATCSSTASRPRSSSRLWATSAARSAHRCCSTSSSSSLTRHARTRSRRAGQFTPRARACASRRGR